MKSNCGFKLSFSLSALHQAQDEMRCCPKVQWLTDHVKDLPRNGHLAKLKESKTIMNCGEMSKREIKRV